MSMVGPTFGPETYRYGGAARPPQQRPEDRCATTSFTESFQPGGDHLTDRVAAFASWVKRHDGGSRDNNGVANAVCLKLNTSDTSRVLGTVLDSGDSTRVHRLVENKDGSSVATGVTIQDGSVEGFEITRSGNEVSGKKFQSFAGFDELTVTNLVGNEAKGAYAKVFIDVTPIV